MRREPSRSTILIVDDEPDLREVVAELLEMEDYTVLQAANGQAALEVLASQPQPCLVLLDLMMPVMDGHEFLHRLRQDERHRELPVLMLTAHFSAKAPPGTVGLLRKPVDIAELLAMVARHCPAA
ncbi:response regulator [Corallococcus exercitus]|uniref:response regulator n=1 Tax=Corallococcus exercitus TaxID=2316736 RepID=UPI0035D4A56C